MTQTKIIHHRCIKTVPVLAKQVHQLNAQQTPHNKQPIEPAVVTPRLQQIAQQTLHSKPPIAPAVVTADP
jgi:hypothetical protein